MASVIVHNSQETKMKRMFVEGVELGMDFTQAAKYAGSKNPKSFCDNLRKDEWTQNELKKVHQRNREMFEMSREKVQKIVMDAVEMAAVIADPSSMIRGAAELNKMCGYYAPEEKKILIEGKMRRVQTEFEAMSDADLIAAMGEEQDIIEGEFEAFEDDEVA